MKRRPIPKWQRSLTAKERAHLREDGIEIRTFTAFKTTAAGQVVLRRKYEKDDYEPCWTYRTIARKLGLEV